jgi:PAS domain S-box-containing protein
MLPSPMKRKAAPRKQAARGESAAALRARLARVERSLRDTQERYESAMGAINESVYDWDIAGDRIFYADQMERSLGLPPRALNTMQDWLERVHPDDLQRLQETTFAHFKGQTPRMQCDYRYRAREGEWRWARSHGLARRDASGRAYRMIGATGDITELKQAEIERAATAEILHVMAASRGDAQPVFDAIARNAADLCGGALCSLFLFDGRLQHFAAHYGVDDHVVELLRSRYPSPPDPTRASGAAILERKTVHIDDATVDARFPGTSSLFGRTGYRAGLAVPMLKDGQTAGLIFVVRREARPFSAQHIGLLRTFADQAVIATDNVRLYNETREALEQQQAAGEVLHAISSSVADAAPVFNVILENAQRLCDASFASVFLYDGEFLRSVAHHSASAEFARYLNSTPGRPSRQTTTRRCALERRTIHTPDLLNDPEFDPPEAQRRENVRTALSVPMMREGALIGVISLWRNEVRPFSDKQVALVRTFADQAVIAIENARLFSEIREKSRQLEIASRHKSQFLANMSHELRTPLNAIIGFTRIVMRHSQQALEPKQYENLEKIQAGGQQLLALINSVLDLSKIEAGRVEVHAAEVGLAPVLEQCARTIEPLVKADSVALVQEFDGGLPRMYVDEEKLRQIVLNLLSNAAKFTARGSIRLRAEAAGGAVAVAVADTGIGIPPEKHELIFEEFEQAHAGASRGGSGLGLAIARRLARLMGGDIEVRSAPGSGSTFTLRLPLRYAA